MTAGDAAVSDDTRPRYVVTGGGTPTDAELAALTIALTPIVGARREEGDPTPAWRRAALIESTGDRIVRDPWALAALR